MSNDAYQRIMDLTLKGFLPLMMVAAVLWAAYVLIDRMITVQDAQNERVWDTVVSAIRDNKATYARIETKLNRMDEKLNRLVLPPTQEPQQ